MNITSPMGFYSNEVNFYSEGAPLTPMSTAKVYDASFDAESGDFVLLIEDIGGRQCLDQTVGCTEHAAEVAIDALAKMHAHWWNSDFKQIPWVKNYVDPPYPQIIAGMFKQAWPVTLRDSRQSDGAAHSRVRRTLPRSCAVVPRASVAAAVHVLSRRLPPRQSLLRQRRLRAARSPSSTGNSRSRATPATTSATSSARAWRPTCVARSGRRWSTVTAAAIESCGPRVGSRPA